MSLLSISPFQILFTAFAVAVLYISAIMILFRNKSGFLPYIALVLIPVLGPAGIILGSYFNRTK